MSKSPVSSAASEFLTLARLLGDVEELQWTAAPIPKPREDVTDRKSSGGHGDPTADIALDPRRLELRQAYTKATERLDELRFSAQIAREDLERAVARYHGEG